jgi:hypothetical protein
MPEHDESPREQEVDSPPGRSTGWLHSVPGWRKALWVVAVLYGLYLIVTAFTE